MIIAMHQPDLLPYSGFWHKMALADVFEVGIHFQYSQKGYQRRVRMRGEWAAVPVRVTSRRVPIHEARIDPDTAPRLLADLIAGRYGGSRYWRSRGHDLLDLVTEIHTDKLWQLNTELILKVRDLLGITTPVTIGGPLQGQKVDAIVNAMLRYGEDATTHLSGPGAREYIGAGIEFKEAGIDLRFTNHLPVTGDSIVSVLMDCREPLDVVLREAS